MRPNQRVTLELTDSEPVVRYHSRIEGVDVDCLLLAAPIHQGRTVALSVGTKLRVTLFHNGGAHAFETAVVGREGFPVPLLRVERPIRMEALQRRQFFREPAVVRSLCSLTRSGRSEIQGVTRNIGGGGACLRSTDSEQIRRLADEGRLDEPMWLQLGLPDRPLEALAQMTWCHFAEDGSQVDMAFEFLDLDETERERLIRYLFVLQRESLRKGC